MTTAHQEPSLASEFDTAWKKQAECIEADTSIFFDERKLGAKRYCNSCPVKIDCLDWALLTDQRFGIWGGLTSKQRDQRYSPAVREAMREDLS